MTPLPIVPPYSCYMYLRLCPDGSEGATYAMLTTFGNIALAVGSSIGRWSGGGGSSDAIRYSPFVLWWSLYLRVAIEPYLGCVE